MWLCDRKQHGTPRWDLQNKAVSTEDLAFTLCMFCGLYFGPALIYSPGLNADYWLEHII